MADKILALDGLNDAKLCRLVEQLLGTIPGVEMAHIDFLSQKLTLRIEGRDTAETVAEAIETLQDSIPTVTIRLSEVGAGSEEPIGMHGRTQPISLDDDPYRWSGDAEDGDSKRESMLQRQFRLDADGVLFSFAWGFAVLFFILSQVFDKSRIANDFFNILTFMLCTMSLLMFKPKAEFINFRPATVLTALGSIALYLIGQHQQSALVMLIYHSGMLLATTINSFYQREQERVVDMGDDIVERLSGNLHESVPAEEVREGNLLVIQPGQVIPFDAEVVDGESEINTSVLTGEEEPILIRAGSAVCCGDVNLDSPITIMVKQVREASAAYQIQEILHVQPKQSTRISALVGSWAAVLSALACVIAIWFLFSRGEALSQTIPQAFAFVLLTLPGGVSLSVYATQQAGLSRAVRRGVVMRSANALEAAASVHRAVLSYTGVLTEQNYEVIGTAATEHANADMLLEMAAYLENCSNHPIAQTIVETYRQTAERELTTSRIAMCEPVAGCGVRGMLDGQVMLAGSERLMRDAGVEVPQNLSGDISVYLSIRGEYIGAILLRDALRPGAGELIQQLRDCGLEKIALLTGCDRSVATVAAEQLRIEDVFAEQSANEKLKALEALLAPLNRGKELLFVCGPSDLRLLAYPCTNVVLGADLTKITPGTVDVAIPSHHPEKVAELLKVSQSTMRWAIGGAVVYLAAKVILLCGVAAWGLSAVGAAIASAVLTSLLALNALVMSKRH